MKNLVLIRHAKSSWEYPELSDQERPLNKRGKRDAPVMGARLKKYGIDPDLVISSPAIRAITTAKIIAREIEYPLINIVQDSRIYETGVSTLIRMVQDLNDSHTQVILVGHNPYIAMLAQYFTEYRFYKFPTCSVFFVAFNVNAWKEVSKSSGKLILFDYPKNLEQYPTGILQNPEL